MPDKGNRLINSELRPAIRLSKNFSIFLIILITITLTLVCSGFFIQPSAAPGKKQINRTVKELDFLSSSQKEALVLTIHTGIKDGLLDYQNEIGTKTLLNTLKDKATSPENKVKFIQTYQEPLEKDLPVYLITKTSVRLFRTGAPFNTVLSTVRAQVSLLKDIDQYLQQEGIDQYLTHEDKTLLIDTLAESVLTYSRQKSDSEGSVPSDEEINKLKQTTENMIKFSTLPVSFQQGTKGGSTSEETNPQLTEFLRDKGTIKDLAKLAQEFSQPEQ